MKRNYLNQRHRSKHDPIPMGFVSYNFSDWRNAFGLFSVLRNQDTMKVSNRSLDSTLGKAIYELNTNIRNFEYFYIKNKIFFRKCLYDAFLDSLGEDSFYEDYQKYLTPKQRKKMRIEIAKVIFNVYKLKERKLNRAYVTLKMKPCIENIVFEKDVKGSALSSFVSYSTG